MNISPQRRRRSLECQKLRQQGYVIRDIASFLEVSPATVHADLKLLETNWSDVTGQAADDMLLEHLDQLRTRLAALLEHDPLEIFHKFIISAGDGYLRTWVDQLSASDLVRIHQARAAEVTSLFREIRRTINDMHRRGVQRRAELADASIEYPPEELADAGFQYPDHPDDDLATLNLAEHDRTTLNNPEREQAPSAQQEQEILSPRPAEKISPEQPEQTEQPDADRPDVDFPELDEDPEQRLNQLLQLIGDVNRESAGPDQPVRGGYSDAAGA